MGIDVIVQDTVCMQGFISPNNRLFLANGQAYMCCMPECVMRRFHENTLLSIRSIMNANYV